MLLHTQHTMGVSTLKGRYESRVRFTVRVCTCRISLTDTVVCRLPPPPPLTGLEANDILPYNFSETKKLTAPSRAEYWRGEKQVLVLSCYTYEPLLLPARLVHRPPEHRNVVNLHTGWGVRKCSQAYPHRLPELLRWDRLLVLHGLSLHPLPGWGAQSFARRFYLCRSSEACPSASFHRRDRSRRPYTDKM